MVNSFLKPDYVFETSWEVCNKTWGIHNVLSSKARNLADQFGDKIMFIGPDVWRGPNRNPEFLPDDKFLPEWQEILMRESGLRVKIGRWNIPGKPVVFLVDFSSLVSFKDKIFARLWESFNLDSLTGQWDYVEPALFGYASGMVIESYYKYFISESEKVVAHFHEWMTGSGALYLHDHLLQVGTIFTTHATVVGRAIASRGEPLYQNINTFDADAKAAEFGVVSKHSMEKITARNADCFTTVSEITAQECVRFLLRDPDVVTPNGFDFSVVPQGDAYEKKRKASREKLAKVAGALLGAKISKDALFVMNSGRYEYRNKGADVFLDVLKQLNEDPAVKQDIMAFVLIPANTFGPRKDLISRLKGETPTKGPLSNPFLTHGLNDLGYDPIINKIQEIHLSNAASERVKLIFVPCYLNGKDGIFDIPYYDLVMGMDLAIFPTYYAPWGYAPHESIAYGVPAVTTNLSGFGIWASQHSKGIEDGVELISRNDENYQEVVNDIARLVRDYSGKGDETQEISHRAMKLAEMLSWDSLIKNYYNAYDIALREVNNRRDKLVAVKRNARIKLRPQTSPTPGWKKLIVKSRLPERIEVLHELSRNLWWSWNYQLVDLFESIDPEIWEAVGKNPVQLLDKVSYERFNKLASDKEFVSRLDSVYECFRAYMDRDYTEQPRIAYFSMEYGLTNVLKIYSGGLGILAGDYLKEASDRGVKMVAVGLLYRYGYFTQTLSINGEQTANYEIQDFSKLPLVEVRDSEGHPLYINLELPGRELHAKVWKAQVGRVSLYLLDADVAGNSDADRQITHQLYGGDWENRLKQEMLLGLGGIRLLKKLNAHVDVFHINEGHAALIGIERLVNLVEQKYSFSEAMEIVRATSLFTTHTPVPAGHDKFHEDLFRIYLRHIPAKLKISWEDFMDLGRENPGDANELFSMSVLAAKSSQEMNGVSQLHGTVAREMFSNLWRGYFPEEFHVGYVTNGVHYASWTASVWQNFYREIFGKDFLSDVSNKDSWSRIYDVPDEKIWEVRHTLRQKLMDFIRQRLTNTMSKRHDAPGHIVEVLDILDEDALTIGFARRFATYKRAGLLFRDLERLSEIVNDFERPVQFIFAGKAHPADEAGQKLIKDIVEISKQPEFVGKIIFLENYDMELAKRLVSGVDVWLNTPTRPLEASGTSGQKAELNGVLNFSVLDGWWYEGYEEEAGWSLTEKRSFDNQEFQDELDAATIYSMLENEIVPLFYDVNEDGIPSGWVRYIKNSIAHIAPQFTTRRMIDDYLSKFYRPMHQRVEELCANDCELVHEIASWKRHVSAGWENVEILEVNMPDIAKQELGIGDEYVVEVKLDLKQLKNVDVGMEMLIVESTNEEFPPILHKEPFELVKRNDSIVVFQMKYKLNLPGSFRFGIRMFPYNEYLPHQQDFCLVRWF